MAYTLPNFAGDGGSSMSPGRSQNQYMNFPSMGGPSAPTSQMESPFSSMDYTSFVPAKGTPAYPMPQQPTGNPPGVVPQAPSLPVPGSGYPNTPSKAGGFGLQGGAATGPSMDPQLSNIWGQFLQSMLGTGVTPFNLSALLPSSGQATTPGSLSAPLTSSLQGLQDFYAGTSQGVTGVPGTSSPLNYVSPMWQSEVASMNQPIQQQLANIKEQFGSQGALGSSEMAQAMANYGQQTALGEQNLLGQLTMQALPQQQAFGGELQTQDQQAIQNMYQEFIRTQPQYNPLMSDIQSYASTFPPVYTKQGGIGGALVGSAGDIMGGLSSLIPILTGLCWLSRAIYGDSDWRVAKIRASWPRLFNESRFYRVVFALYILIGEPLAKLVKRSNTLKRLFRPLLDSLLRKAMEA